MPRLHLFEIEDQPWCPRSLRDAATDYLRFAFSVSNPYTAPLPRVIAALKRNGASSVIDMCAGGGGPWKQLLPLLRAELPDVRVTLTDLYPNEEAFRSVGRELGIGYELRSVDATSPPADLTGFRTLFTGFHHFRPAIAKRILDGAVASGEGIAVLEFTERRPLTFMVMLTVPLIVLFTIPFIRPFRWSRILWTYPIPVLPLLAMWDGLVSCARSYTPAEMRGMVTDHDSYDWEIGTDPAPKGPGRVTYLIGTPKR
ncbi:MAG: class I SAM-dependent methyltransferase [Longimicrobiales bacterium]